MKPRAPRSALKKQLWKCMLASKCIQRVRAGCDLLESKRFLPESLEHYVIMAGIVTTYAKPFTQNNIVGRLPEKYATFSRQELTELHRELLNSRHELYGHQTPDHLTVGFHVVKAESQPAECGPFNLIPVRWEKIVAATQLPKIQELCGEIFAKLQEDYPALLKAIFGTASLTENEVIQLNLADES